MELLNKEELGNLRRAWQKRAVQEKEAELKRRVEALSRAESAAAFLKEKYKVKAVYVYGSLVWGKHFTPRSDIDLLVDGFPKEENYWRMLLELEELAVPWVISVVLSEAADESLREKARKEGKML